MNVDLMRKAIYNSASQDTCSYLVKESWTKDNPLFGHCAIASIIINDYFGYEIRKAYIPELKTYHYYNYDGKNIVDITKEQFQKYPNLINEETRSKEHLLNDSDTKLRYEKLKEKVVKYLNEDSRI